MLNNLWIFLVIFSLPDSEGAVELVPNVALNGEATQSSSNHHKDRFPDPDSAHYAIDGNLEADILDNYARCALTTVETGPWWQVDLKQEFNILEVAVTGRKYYHARLTDFYIDVSNNADGSAARNCAVENTSFKSSETRVYTCPNSLQGRYVRIRFTPYRKEILDLCEVQVKGECPTGNDDCELCDSKKNSFQCISKKISEKICKNYICETAHNCSSGDDCSTIPSTSCVSDYCQPAECRVTGQCVYGQVCTQSGNCAYRKIFSVEEDSEIVLKFVETAKDGAYGDMTWYKGSIDVDKRIATALHSTNFRAVYFNEYCSGRDQCRTTDKAALDTITGEMTIHNVAPIDDDYYYYAYSTINSGIQDIGKKYEIKVEVYVKPKLEEMKIEVSESNSEMTLTCVVNRIKPRASDLYFTIAGRRYNGSVVITQNADGTLANKVEMSILKLERPFALKCTVVPIFGDTVSKEEQFSDEKDIITVKPKVEEMKIEVFESNSEMILTCVVNRIKPSASDLYFTIGGRRYNGSVVITQNADGTLINKVVLRMLKPVQPFLTKCTVVPVDGDSVSVQKEIFTEKDNMGPFFAASTTPEVNIGLIGGVSAAVVVTIILVAVTIVFIKRCKLQATENTDSPRDRSVDPTQQKNKFLESNENKNQVQVVEEHFYESLPDDLKRDLAERKEYQSLQDVDDTPDYLAPHDYLTLQDDYGNPEKERLNSGVYLTPLHTLVKDN